MDECQTIIDLLDGDWDTDVIAKPTIGKKSAVTNVDVARGDFVLAYRGPSSFTPIGISHDHQAADYSVTLDIRTDSGDDLRSVLSEVERIINANRLDQGSGFPYTFPIILGHDFDDLQIRNITFPINYRKLKVALCTIHLYKHKESLE